MTFIYSRYQGEQLVCPGESFVPQGSVEKEINSERPYTFRLQDLTDDPLEVEEKVYLKKRFLNDERIRQLFSGCVRACAGGIISGCFSGFTQKALFIGSVVGVGCVPNLLIQGVVLVVLGVTTVASME